MLWITLSLETSSWKWTKSAHDVWVFSLKLTLKYTCPNGPYIFPAWDPWDWQVYLPIHEWLMWFVKSHGSFPKHSMYGTLVCLVYTIPTLTIKKKLTIHGSVNIPFPWLLWGMLCWSIWYFKLSSSKGLILLWDLGWWPTFIDFIESKITTEFTEEDWCFVSIWINPAGTNRSLDYVNPKRQSHQNHQTSQK